MGFDVAHRRAAGVRDRLQRADLIDDVGEQILGRHVDEASAESGQVAVAHLCSDAHPGLGGRSAHPHQAGRIAGVETTGHVGAGDDSEHGVVIAEPPDAEALAQVGVDVNTGHVPTLGAGSAWDPGEHLI
jgi:hypothetical protein